MTYYKKKKLFELMKAYFGDELMPKMVDCEYRFNRGAEFLDFSTVFNSNIKYSCLRVRLYSSRCPDGIFNLTVEDFDEVKEVNFICHHVSSKPLSYFLENHFKID